MMKRDSVLCVCCGRDFDVGLLELVRWSGPLWCQPCILKADDELVEASRRAEKAQDRPAWVRRYTEKGE
jgi:hypothetical protein